jgi:class 3 adenylate cyclase
MRFESGLADVADRQEAQVVTALFTDIEGSTELARRLGPQAWKRTLVEHHRIVGEAIGAHGGAVVQTEGDSFLAFFADAAAAVVAAIGAQRALCEYDWGEEGGTVKVRMGAHTGLVERSGAGYVGLDLHLAARVMAAANGGQILITATTRRRLGESIEVVNLGEHRLKDFPEPERLYHVVVGPAGAVPQPRAGLSGRRTCRRSSAT